MKRKAKINRHAASLFFRQTVWISAGESLDYGRFAVVDMSGCTQDDSSHFKDLLPLFGHSLDVGAEAAQFLLYGLIAAIDVIDARNMRLSLGHEPGEDERGAGP